MKVKHEPRSLLLSASVHVLLGLALPGIILPGCGYDHPTAPVTANGIESSSQAVTSTEGPATTNAPTGAETSATTTTVPPPLTSVDVGTLAGELGATPFGAATYEIPLWVPEARGLEPHLSLAYSSAGGEGVAGKGWSLGAGESSIHRCPGDSRRFDRAQPLTFLSFEGDQICLDGAPLILVSGAYGAVGSKYRTEPDTFAEVSIEAVDQQVPTSFIVKTRDSLIHEYGSTTDTSLFVQGWTAAWRAPVEDRSDSSVVNDLTQRTQVRYAWLRGKTTDRFGNAIVYRYGHPAEASADLGFQEARLTTVEYGFFANQPKRRLSFGYLSRSDAGSRRDRYVAGLHFRTSQLLRSIDVEVVPATGSAFSSVRYYELTHTVSTLTRHALLQQVKECDGNPATAGRTVVCRKPTKFDYEPGSDSFTDLATGIKDVRNASDTDFWTIYPADLNHDGKDDIVYRARPAGATSGNLHWYYRLSTGSGFGLAVDMKLAENEVPGDPIIADFDKSDGRPDIAVPASADTYAFFSNTAATAFTTFTNGTTGTLTRGVQIGDFGGRGQLTMLRPLTSFGWGYAVFQPGKTSAVSGPLECNWENRWQTIGWSGQAVDVDGDGAADSLTLPAGGVSPGANRLQIMRQIHAVPTAPASNGQVISDQFDYDDTTLVAPNTGDVTKHIFFDHNGDGLPDALRLRQGEATPSLIVNSGNGFANVQPLSGLALSAWNIRLGAGTQGRDLSDPGVRILDFDGDGRQDLLLVDNGVSRDSTVASSPTRSTVQVLLSRGEGQFEAKSTSIPIGMPADGAFKPAAAHVRNYKQSQLLDANGDGLTDLVQVAASDGALHLYLRQGGKREVLVSVTDGLGKRSGITYAPMSDSSVYTPGTSCAFPQQCAVRGPWLVKSHRTDNGIGGAQNERQLRYKDGRVDLQGGGYLGISEWSSTDVASSTTTTESFDLTSTAQVPMRSDPSKRVAIYNKIATPIRRTVTTNDPGFTRVSETTFDYDFITTNAERSYYRRPKATHVIETETRASITKTLRDETTTFVYDQALNDLGVLSGLSSTASTTRGTFTSSWSASYQNDTNQWLLGVPLDRTEKSRTPAGEEVTRFTQFSPEPGKGVSRFVDIEALGDADTFLRLEYVRNAFGQVTALKRIDRAAVIRTEEITYDEQSIHPRTYKNAVGHVTTIVADSTFGRPRTVTDANNTVTSYDYDFFGLLRRVNYPGGFGTSLTYTRLAEPGSVAADARDATRIATTFDGGGEIRTLLNRVGQEIHRERKNLDASFSFEDRAYSELGLLAALTRPAKVGSAAGAASTWVYDELGRPTSRTRAEDGLNAAGTAVSSATFSTRFDGLTSSMTDEFGRERAITYDEFGRVTRSDLRNDGGQLLPTEYTYGPFDVLRFAVRKDGTAAKVQTTESRYDVRGRKILYSDPDTGSRGFKYNAFGEVREQTDAAGAVNTFIRDLLGRITKRQDKDGTTTFTWDTAANGKGQLADTTSASGVRRQFFYDTSARMNREIWTIRGVTYQLDYSYDVEGRLGKVSYPNVTGFSRLVVSNVYDPDSGELSKVVNDANASVFWELKSTEVDGQVKQEAFGNKVLTDYAYSAKTGRVGTIKTTLPGTTTALRSWAYGYWMDGNLQRRSDVLASQHERFEYDGVDRIKKWMAADSSGKPLAGGWTVNYTVDDLGNLARRQFVAGTSTGGTSQDLSFTVFPGTNRVQTSPWGSYAYDANGNQTARPEGEGVTYTTFDLPKTITGPRAASFLYDSFGTRAEKKKSDTDFTVYVGGVYEKRKSSAGTDHIFYIAANGRSVAQLARREGGAETAVYLHADRLGSVDAVSDSAGKVAERTKLDPFGNKISNFNQPVLPNTIAASANKVRLGFTGHEQDDELGMINMRGRMYDPRLGRFLTVDPFVSRPLSSQSYNRYGYVLNNPTRYTDPTGWQLTAEDCFYGEYKWADGLCHSQPEPVTCVTDPNGTSCSTPSPQNTTPSTTPDPGSSLGTGSTPDPGPTTGGGGPTTPSTTPTPTTMDPGTTDGSGSPMTTPTQPQAGPKVKQASAVYPLDLVVVAAAAALTLVAIWAVHQTSQLFNNMQMSRSGPTPWTFGTFGQNGPADTSGGLRSEAKGQTAGGTLTPGEQKALQDIADRYGTEIDVIGSRAKGEGRNIDTDLPIGKGEGTRSDIDVRIDSQVDIDTGGALSDELKDLGADVRPRLPNGSTPPVITIKPQE
jgi:RHS repeat-associated protein